MNKIETGGPAFPVDNVIARDESGRLVGTEISALRNNVLKAPGR